MTKRISALVLCLMVCVSAIFGGCNNSAPQEMSSEVQSSAVPESAPSESAPAAEKTVFSGLELPLTDTGEVLRLTTSECYASDKSFADEIFPVFAEGAKATGVTLEWEVVKPDYKTVMKTRLAAGSELADIMTIEADPLMANYIEAGLFQPLSTLINESAPNIKRYYYENRPDIRKMMTFTDGEIYLLSNDSNGLEEGTTCDNYVNPICLILRNDLLKQLNLPEPQTAEEFYNYYKGVKELGYIPYVIRNRNISTDPFEYTAFASLFGFNIGVGFSTGYGRNGRLVEGLYENADGKVVSAYFEPGFKDFLAEMNRWYNEGFFKVTAENDEYNSDIISGQAASYYYNVGGVRTYLSKLQANVPEADLVPAKIPSPSTSVFNGFTAITKDCKNPKLALQWLDYMFYTEKGMRDQIFGVEGVSYYLKPDGTPDFTPEYKDQVVVDSNVLYRLGCHAAMLPRVLQKSTRGAVYQMYYANNRPILDEYVPWLGEHAYSLLPTMLTTDTELEVINNYVPDLSTYIGEMISKFIAGQEPLTNYDAFLSQLESMGIKEVIEIQQQQLDRFNNN